MAKQCPRSGRDTWFFTAGHSGGDADERASPTPEIPVLESLRKPEGKRGWWKDSVGFAEAVSFPPLLLLANALNTVVS